MKSNKAVVLTVAAAGLIVLAAAAAAASGLAEKFAGVCGALANQAEAEQTMTVAGRDGWLFLANELRHVAAGAFWGKDAARASRAAKAADADPLPAILDFQKQLAARKIDLVFVPVPPKCVVYPDFLGDAVLVPPGKSPARLDEAQIAFYALLRKSGVAVLDLTETFLAGRFSPEGALYCRQDSHWSGNGCVVAAAKLAAEARQKPWFKAVAKKTYRTAWSNKQIAGDLWRAMKGPQPPKEELHVRFVGLPGSGGLDPAPPDPASPVVLLGDSHNLVFQAGEDMHLRGAGLADQLAAEMGFPVDLVAVRGSGATPARVNLLRRAQRDGRYWAGKKLVFWCFAAREFTQSDGWKKVPIAP